MSKEKRTCNCCLEKKYVCPQCGWCKACAAADDAEFERESEEPACDGEVCVSWRKARKR